MEVSSKGIALTRQVSKNLSFSIPKKNLCSCTISAIVDIFEDFSVAKKDIHDLNPFLLFSFWPLFQQHGLVWDMAY